MGEMIRMAEERKSVSEEPSTAAAPVSPARPAPKAAVPARRRFWREWWWALSHMGHIAQSVTVALRAAQMSKLVIPAPTDPNEHRVLWGMGYRGGFEDARVLDVQVQAKMLHALYRRFELFYDIHNDRAIKESEVARQHRVLEKSARQAEAKRKPEEAT